MKVTWTDQAWERLLEIERFVARDDPRAASRLVDKLIDRGDALAEQPERGRRLADLPHSGLRELIVDNYRLVYRRTPKAVEVLTVFEGHRLLRPDELLPEEGSRRLDGSD
jgi:addiction module RelE/StbE family toxin